MDVNDIDTALLNIGLMIRVALRATDSLQGSDADPCLFQMAADDAEMLSFSLVDLEERVSNLRAGLFERPKDAPCD